MARITAVTGDVIFTQSADSKCTGRVPFVTTLEQRPGEAWALFSRQSFSHVAIVLDGHHALEVVPRPSSREAREPPTRKVCPTGPQKTWWSEVDLWHGVRIVPVVDMVIAAAAGSIGMVVLRSPRLAPSMELRLAAIAGHVKGIMGHDWYGDEFAASIVDGLNVFPASLCANLKRMVARCLAAITHNIEKSSVLKKLPAFDLGRRPRAAACAQLVADLLERARVLPRTQGRQTPSGLYCRLLGFEWYDVTMRDYSFKAAEAILQDEAAKERVRGVFASAVQELELWGSHIGLDEQVSVLAKVADGIGERTKALEDLALRHRMHACEERKT